MGYAGATAEAIAAAEDRIGAELPPSYKSFLQVSNGFSMIRTVVMPGRLWAVEEIYWIRDYDPYDLKSWGTICDPTEDDSAEEHLYWRDVENSSVAYRQACVENLLNISDHGDACDLLLSPEVVDGQGEWECWHIANWYPGAARCRSFETWMKERYEFMAQVQ